MKLTEATLRESEALQVLRAFRAFNQRELAKFLIQSRRYEEALVEALAARLKHQRDSAGARREIQTAQRYWQDADSDLPERKAMDGISEGAFRRETEVGDRAESDRESDR